MGSDLQSRKGVDGDRNGHELFFGLVGPTGVDNTLIQGYLEEALQEFGYSLQSHQMSAYLEETPLSTKFGYSIDKLSSYKETESGMDAGDKVRKQSQHNAFLAMYAVAKIAEKRHSGSNYQSSAHLFRSLKNPAETDFLRKTYGFGYFQFGVYATEDDRIDYLRRKKGIENRSDALKLIERDEQEEEKFGQQTAETFHLSDFFIRLEYKHPKAAKDQIIRALDLIFSHPHITPTRDEQLMFMAYSYAARSGDLSRQVGAVLSNPFGDIIGSGSNDVPKHGGGPYWPADDGSDQRDAVRGGDANKEKRNQIIVEIARRLDPEVTDLPDSEAARKAIQKLNGAKILDITEFSRATHAEMDAILSCARSGISTRGATLYCTTFPCHNCAKHIVSAGIERVVYVEPYPKSHAKDLHGDAISFGEGETDKVLFESFIGVAARRYLDLFSLKIGWGREKPRADKLTGTPLKFSRKDAKVRVPMLITNYEENERFCATKVAETLA